MRAGDVRYQFGRAGPPASLSSGVGRMKRHKFPALLLVMLALIVVYGVSFASWWASSSITTRTEGGRLVRHVELRMTPFRWHTIYVWVPAIWFMQDVRGYRLEKEIAAGPDSVYFYAK